jgi:hypothetical protein
MFPEFTAKIIKVSGTGKNFAMADGSNKLYTFGIK